MLTERTTALWAVYGHFYYHHVMERYSCKHWVQLLFDSGSSSPGADFFLSGSGPRGSGWRNADRDKHWLQLQFDMHQFPTQNGAADDY